MTELELTNQLLEIKDNLQSSTEKDAIYFYGRLGPLCYRDGLLDDIVTKTLYQTILKSYDEKYSIKSRYPYLYLMYKLDEIKRLKDSERERTLEIIDKMMEVYYDAEDLISDGDKEKFKAQLLINSLAKGIIIKFK